MKLEPFPQLSLEALRNGPIIAPGHQEVAFSDFIFPTPSGKIELYSQEAIVCWDSEPLPNYSESEEVRNKKSTLKYSLHFLTPNTKNRIHSQFNNLDMIRQFSETTSHYLSIAL